MTIEIAPLPMKPPRLHGLSQQLVDSHYENNYGGAVRRLNAIDARLSQMDWLSTSGATPGFEINALKREQLIAAGSVLLHEVYFDSLGGDGGDPDPGPLADAIERDYGGVEAWRREFVAMGKALSGGSGWVLLTWSHRLGRLTSQWAADHAHALAGACPILALDMYEHAYHRDFGADADAYVDTFMRNVHWPRVAARFEAATHSGGPPSVAPTNSMTATELHQELEASTSGPPVVLDVRLSQDRGGDALPGTPWRDMDKVDEWCPELPRDRKVVVYCMYGSWVSQDTAAALRDRGYDAEVLAGGIAAWRGMGLPTEPIEGESE